MSNLFDLLKDNKAVQSLLKGEREFVTDDTIGVALLAASSFIKKPQKYNIITSNLYNAQKIYDLLSTFIGEDNCLFYPCDEMMRLDSAVASKEMLAQRLFVMDKLLEKENYILICHAASAMRFVPSPELFENNSIVFEKGKKFDLQELKNTLSKIGYNKVNKIDHSLQFAIRGDILDINSVNYTYPVRIEFFDDEVESIRFFDMSTQESINNVDCVKVIPADEYLVSENEREEIFKKLDEQLKKDLKQSYCKDKDWLMENVRLLKDKLHNSASLSCAPNYYSFFQENYFSILNYSRNATTIIANKTQLYVASKMLLEESTDRFLALFEEGKVLSHIAVYRNIEKVLSTVKTSICTIDEFSKTGKEIIFNVRPIGSTASTLSQAVDLIKNYSSTHEKILISLSNKQQYEVIKNLLIENELEFSELINVSIPKEKIGICISVIDEGFDLINENIAVLSTKELFNYKNKISRYTNRYKEAVILKSEQDLEPGDYVVHEVHGIGQFIDITTLEVDGGAHRDYLHIQYAGTDKLYIPLEQYKLVRKFVGKEGHTPKLSKLGSNDWEKTKKKIKNRISDMADRLFKLYSERSQIEGFAFSKDDELQYEFESRFPFEMTKDQQKSIDEIKSDMEKPEPMDRLLCGDVGFGKTEVAFRAAFKAILDGKQVALLCPTTLLARQHYERALDRFSSFGVKIAVLSRLIDARKQKDYMKRIESGDIDLVIATHRIFSNQLHFKDLGLLIVDEEQRFGVAQKEKIKELKTNVDVLTLTATPIPRTLQISLLGMRQLSQLNTSPKNRMPIQTYVMPQNNEEIKELIERELARKGQVFYLHNRVDSIFNVASRLEKTVKSARVGVVHGKMDKETIEDVMLQFYNNEINVLVCTSIIETGIDIANANLMIIEDADHFGLSQLYQIKGRVGRGSTIAYAYLLYNANKEMNEVARKRLKAIQDFTELGSGFKIAQRDLLIRGAGDILGAEQAGFIDTVGVDMYIQLLNEAIEERKTGIAKEKPAYKTTISVDAYLPADFVAKTDKINVYQEIDEAQSLEEINKLYNKVRDVYGRIPEEVERLFMKKKIDNIVEKNPHFSELEDKPTYVLLKLSKETSNQNGIGAVLFRSLIQFLNEIKISFINGEITIKLIKKDDWFKKLYDIIFILVEILKD